MSDEPVISWKHIGLYGYAVGTLALYKDTVVWKSALLGRNDGAGDDLSTLTTRKIAASRLKAAIWTWMGKNIGLLRIAIANSDSKQTYQQDWRLDGFPASDFDLLKAKLDALYQIDLQIGNMSAAGTQYGIPSIKNKWLTLSHCNLQDDLNEEGQEFEVVVSEPICHLDLNEITQCVIPGNNNRNEIELQFPESDTIEAGTDQLGTLTSQSSFSLLWRAFFADSRTHSPTSSQPHRPVSIRMYIPPDAEADPADKEAETAAELLQQQIMNAANIRKNAATGDVLLVSFDPSKGAFLTPRGRYGIELYDTYLRMRGQKYDYKIRYDDINRLFLLPKPDEVHMAFVIALDKPIRQGNQRYQYLVMQASKEPDEVVVNMDEEALEREYKGELQPVMRGSLSNLIAKTFKVIADKKVFIPGKFANANQQASLSCSVRANEGLLYPLEKQFVFIHKPPIIVRFNEIDSVEFQRYAGGQGSTRNFDLCVNLKSSVVAGGGVKDYTFSGIDRSDYPGLYSFLSGKKIPIKNLEQGFSMDDGNKVAKKPVYNEDEIFGRVAGDDDGADEEEESDDESYGKEDAAKDEGPGSEDDEDEESDELDDDDLGSEVDEDLDSDLEEARSGTKRKSSEKSSSKAKKSKKAADSDDDDNDEDEEEEIPKKKAVAKKAKKDANAPKRGMTAYFLYMNENRNRIKQENPDASFGEIVRKLLCMFSLSCL
jgi:structure-specific recognition protein 1